MGIWRMASVRVLRSLNKQLSTKTPSSTSATRAFSSATLSPSLKSPLLRSSHLTPLPLRGGATTVMQYHSGAGRDRDEFMVKPPLNWGVQIVPETKALVVEFTVVQLARTTIRVDIKKISLDQTFNDRGSLNENIVGLYVLHAKCN